MRPTQHFAHRETGCELLRRRVSEIPRSSVSVKLSPLSPPDSTHRNLASCPQSWHFASSFVRSETTSAAILESLKL